MTLDCTQLLVSAIGYILIREAVYLYSTHKLVNKLMSRSYWDYEMAKGAPKRDQAGAHEFKEPSDQEEVIL